MTLPEAVRTVQEHGGGFHRDDIDGPDIMWTVENQGLGLISGRARGATIPIVFHPTGAEVTARDWEWVHPVHVDRFLLGAKR